MDTEEFRKYGKQMIDYICQYLSTIDDRPVAPAVNPGYLSELVPDSAPDDGESFDEIMRDLEPKIMSGVMHWNHPGFHAYFPSANSFPSILGDLLSDAIGAIGFSWASNPVGTELERIVMDWFGKALNLPSFFISSEPGSQGGGVLEGSASECALLCLIAARCRAITMLKGNNDEHHESYYLPKLVAYSSKEAHSSIEKAAKMAIIKLRILDTDSSGRFNVHQLKEAIEMDVANGLTPCFVVATVGTTSSCAFDNLVDIGKVCNQYDSIWFHVDGAYAGNSFILPEMNEFKAGLEYADSFGTNPNKLLLTSFDCSALFIRNIRVFTSSLTVNPLYLEHEHKSAIDYRHYGIALSRRFRSLKLWFVFRTYGIKGLQKYIRNHIQLAKRFESLVRNDERFEICNDVHLGLVCFRLKQSDEINRKFLAKINSVGRLHLVPAMVNGKFTIRFCVNHEHARPEHIDTAWSSIKCYADQVLGELNLTMIQKRKTLTTRTSFARYPFERSVSKDVFVRQHSRNSLTDGCTPIIVLDTDDILADLCEKSKIDASG